MGLFGDVEKWFGLYPAKLRELGVMDELNSTGLARFILLCGKMPNTQGCRRFFNLKLLYGPINRKY